MGSAKNKNIYIDFSKDNDILLEEENQFIFESIQKIFKDQNIEGILNFDLKVDNTEQIKSLRNTNIDCDFLSHFQTKNHKIFIFIECKNYSKTMNNSKDVDLHRNKGKFIEFCKYFMNENIYFYFCFITNDNHYLYKYNKYSIESMDSITIDDVIKECFSNGVNIYYDYKNIIDSFYDYNSVEKFDEKKITHYSNKSDEIFNKIKNDDKNIFFLINGGPGSGKTRFALSFFRNEIKHSILIILNKNLLNSINYYYNEKKMFYSTFSLYNKDLSKTKYILIDEAQRINSKCLDNIKYFSEKYNLKIIFFGDDRQIIFKNDLGLKKLKEEIKINNDATFELKNYFRISENDLKRIEYILDMSTKICNTNYKLKIIVFDDIEDLLKDYEKNNNSFFAIPSVCKNKNIKNFNYIFTDDILFDETITKKYNLVDEFHVISREFENSYIYLPREINENNFSEYVNALYIFMTRSTKSISIFIEDDLIRNYFKNKLLKLEGGN